MNRVAVLGLGLIGGSLARDLAAAGLEVAGYDHDEAASSAARDEGVITRLLRGPDDLGDVDAVVLAVPVRAAPALLRALAPAAAHVALITDVGSTKRAIVAQASALGVGDRFVGAHPLAGHPDHGWAASRRGLFRDARVYLTPAPEAAPEARRLTMELWSRVGARAEWSDAAEHDRRVARTSHLPQALSTTLARTLAAASLAREELGTGGRDMTRIAASDPDVWTDITLDNADELIPALDAFGRELRLLRDALARGDEEAVRALFAQAREWATR